MHCQRRPALPWPRGRGTQPQPPESAIDLPARKKGQHERPQVRQVHAQRPTTSMNGQQHGKRTYAARQPAQAAMSGRQLAPPNGQRGQATEQPARTAMGGDRPTCTTQAPMQAAMSAADPFTSPDSQRMRPQAQPPPNSQRDPATSAAHATALQTASRAAISTPRPPALAPSRRFLSHQIFHLAHAVVERDKLAPERIFPGPPARTCGRNGERTDVRRKRRTGGRRHRMLGRRSRGRNKTHRRSAPCAFRQPTSRCPATPPPEHASTSAPQADVPPPLRAGS